MDGIKRINEMANGQKDFVLLEIVKYLTSRIDMDEKYLNIEKSLKGMAKYIQGEIIKGFCNKMNTDNPENFAQEVKYGKKNLKCLVVGMSEQRTFELAINYFNKSNKELGIKEEKKEIQKINDSSDDKFGSIFDSLQENNIEEKKEEIEQISLFTSF